MAVSSLSGFGREEPDVPDKWVTLFDLNQYVYGLLVSLPLRQGRHTPDRCSCSAWLCLPRARCHCWKAEVPDWVIGSRE